MPQVKVKTYSGEREYERDARKMLGAGWGIQGTAAHQGRVNMGRTAVKAVTLLPWALMRPSRKGDKITVTWVREPEPEPDPATVTTIYRGQPYWWDGNGWHPGTRPEPETITVLSPDGLYWWDGAAWQPVPGRL